MKEQNKDFMKMVGYALVCCVGLAVLYAASLGVRYMFASPVGVVEQAVITNRGAYRIQEYERFYSLRDSILATAVKLATYRGRGLDIRERTECRGLMAVRTDMIARYNAASSAVATKGKWKPGDLPPRMEERKVTGC